jgi:dipeptidyl aminopeptidase/acylaminoacyl peptidase
MGHGFGTSDGTPRQDVAHWRHRADYHSAIAYARSLPDVDPDRIVLWGSSYSAATYFQLRSRTAESLR